ncbi:MAG: O-methyltransferase [Phycisphaerae bacterium]|nr:O-methyltransferase [Phycisphaerae bacterium]
MPAESHAIAMTPQRWANSNRYVRELFTAGEPPAAIGLAQRAADAGLPAIAVPPEVGRLLWIVCRGQYAGRGCRLALELGTLAGYSALWIADGLAPGGRLITLEPNSKHAAFARQVFSESGWTDRIELREKKALDELPRLAAEFGPAFDLFFADAIKTEYPAYFEFARRLLAPNGLFIAHNALGSNTWWIDEPADQAADRDAVDRMNRAVAADPEFDAVLLPIDQGVLIARRRTHSAP